MKRRAPRRLWNPKRKPFRDAPPKFKELFDILLGGGLATGRAARTIWNRYTPRVQLESSDKDSESDATEEIEWEATRPRRSYKPNFKAIFKLSGSCHFKPAVVKLSDFPHHNFKLSSFTCHFKPAVFKLSGLPCSFIIRRNTEASSL